MLLATSVKSGNRDKPSYPKQNGLAKTLKEIGRIERMLYMLDRFTIRHFVGKVRGLNKGRSRNALARVFQLLRLGEIRDLVNRKIRATAQRTEALLTATISLMEYRLYGKSGRCPKRKGDEDQRATAIAFCPR